MRMRVFSVPTNVAFPELLLASTQILTMEPPNGLREKMQERISTCITTRNRSIGKCCRGKVSGPVYNGDSHESSRLRLTQANCARSARADYPGSTRRPRPHCYLRGPPGQVLRDFPGRRYRPGESGRRDRTDCQRCPG